MIKSWKSLLLAFFLAIFAWYSITGQERVETWMDVRIELRGLPPDLVVLAGLPNKIAVRVRGPQGLMRSLTASEISYTLNLPDMKKGTHLIDLSPDHIPLEGPFDVVEISPPMLTLEIENVVSNTVPLQYTFSAALPADIKVGAVHLDPDEVTIRGPESLVKFVKAVKANIPVNASFQPPAAQVQAMIQAPPGTEADVKTTRAYVELSLRTRTLTVERAVEVTLRNGMPAQPPVRTAPEKVRIQLEVPNSWSASSPELAGVSAKIVLPLDTTQAGPFAVDVSVPANVQVSRVTPAKVDIEK